ncbi:flavin monoamine oxidase family protein [Deinococcus planocerae]|uniref:flavin monoamine oxidase family protein n=1 Tax=Deinococcus planocerae TaxID=1737569 RepID=UPI0015E0A9F7|nr:NAD(P)/FAD-dependent oxidoreductase [Deinococcus planocerae]
MSRSALLARLRALFALARLVQTRGWREAQALELAHDARRRALLRAGAAGAAGLALGSRVSAQTPTLPGVRGKAAGAGPVVVVGAGLAGLTAAYRLRRAGVPVRGYEAGQRVGGRVFTQYGVFGGRHVELGGEFIDTGHTSIRRLAGELGVGLRDLLAGDAGDRLLPEVFEFGGRQYTDPQVLEAFGPLARRIEADLASLNVESVSYQTPGNAAGLDRTSLRDYLDRPDVPRFLRDLIEVAYVTEYGLEATEQSSLNLIYLIGTRPERFEIFGVSDMRYTAEEGNGAIPRRLGQLLASDLDLGARLEALTQASDGRYTLTFARGGSSQEVRASRVILALPFSVLRGVELRLPLPEVKRRSIETIGYGTNAKLIAGFSERVWRTRHGSNGYTYSDRAFQTTWESSRTPNAAGPAGALTNFVGGRRGVEVGTGDAEAHVSAWLAEMERVFPGIRGARDASPAIRAHWPGHALSLGSYSAYRVGQWTTIGGAEAEPVGGVHFAGEHTGGTFQGFMEGACASGERAAAEVLAALGRGAKAG